MNKVATVHSGSRQRNFPISYWQLPIRIDAEYPRNLAGRLTIRKEG